jgi:cytochrome c-type biogenesis protein CcmF
MVVHLGVVVVAVALAAATSFGHRGEVQLRAGASATFDGHRVEFVGLAHLATPARTATEALVLVDGHGPLRPAVSQFGRGTEAVGTPAIRSGFEDDVYLTVDALPATAGGPVTIGVTVQPLVAWLWAGGALLVVGSALAAVPGTRRRPTDPVSAPVPTRAAGDGGRRRPAGGAPAEERREPVTAGTAPSAPVPASAPSAPVPAASP